MRVFAHAELASAAWKGPESNICMRRPAAQTIAELRTRTGGMMFRITAPPGGLDACFGMAALHPALRYLYLY